MAFRLEQKSYLIATLATHRRSDLTQECLIIKIQTSSSEQFLEGGRNIEIVLK